MIFRSNFRLLGWSIFIVGVDQISKLIVSHYMYPSESIKILGNVLRLTFVKNPGMAFGIKVGNPIFFTIFAALASVIIIIYLFKLKPEHYWSRFAMASILGGAIGNLIDRIAYKEVIDFIDIRIIHWPVFNVADMAVSLGMIILIVYVIFDNKVESEEEQFETG